VTTTGSPSRSGEHHLSDGSGTEAASDITAAEGDTTEGTMPYAPEGIRVGWIHFALIRGRPDQVADPKAASPACFRIPAALKQLDPRTLEVP